MRHSYIKSITEKVKASYSAIASEFNQTRKRPWPEFDHFSTYASKGAKVLDLGCGNGRLYDFLKSGEPDYLGVDHNLELLKRARENFPEARFEFNDMVDLKIEKGSYDNVYCIAAFHHVPTRKMRKKVLFDIHQSLKKEGVLILTTWNLLQRKYLREILKSFLHSVIALGMKGSWNDLWIKWGNYPLKRYYHAFLPKELRGLFESNQWKIEEFYFTKKGKRVSFLRSFNFVVIARKK